MKRTLPRVPGTLQGVVLLLPAALAVMGIVVLIPIVPELMRHFADVPQSQYLVLGGVLTMPALCLALFAPLAGWIADRMGRRRLLIGAMCLYTVLGMAPCLLDNLFAIIASRAGVGICEAAILTASTTLISDYFQGHAREKWLANQTAVASVAALVLIGVGGVLGGIFGWRGPFGIYFLGVVLAAAVARFTWEPAGEAAAVPHDGSSPAAEAAVASDQVAVLPLARLSGICAITLFASVMFYTIPTQCSLALNRLGVHDAPTLGLLTVIACLGVPVGTVLFRFVADRPVMQMLTVEFLLMGAGFAWMGRAASPLEFVAAAALNQLGCGMILPTLLTWATSGLAFSVRGRGTGMWQAAFSLGQFLSGLVVTLISARLGGLPPAFTALAIANVVVAVLSVAISFGQPPRTRRGHTTPLN